MMMHSYQISICKAEIISTCIRSLFRHMHALLEHRAEFLTSLL